ncbi:MAG: hypothetical protein GY856_50420 [bacterium]|nr:hypothetical protein [bacterium]
MGGDRPWGVTLGLAFHTVLVAWRWSSSSAGRHRPRRRTPEHIEQTLRMARTFDPDMAHFIAITPWPYSDIYREVADHIAVDDLSQYNLIEPIIQPKAMTLKQVDEAMIRCYRDFYMPKMAAFHSFPDAFRRKYMLSSMKLIMKSSFIVKKLGRLGMPAAMAKILDAAK